MIIDCSYAPNSALPNGSTIYSRISDKNNISADTYKNICVMSSNGMYIDKKWVLIIHTNPHSLKHLGNCESNGSNPAIVLGKNNGGVRYAFIGYTENFF